MRRVVGDYVVDLFIEEKFNEGFRIKQPNIRGH